MFAVIRTGGKQYRVQEGDTLLVERLGGEEGATVDLDQVLMVGGDGSTRVGAPSVAGAKVSAQIVAQERGDKILVFKKKRRKGFRRTRGHRQDLTRLKITDISAG